MFRRMSFDIGACDFIETLRAGIGPQRHEITFERLDETQAVGVGVDAKPHVRRQTGIAGDLAGDRAVLPDEVILEPGLGLAQRVHWLMATRLSVASAAMRRACPSSASNSSSGGMLSSRSIMVETFPKRRTAAR